MGLTINITLEHYQLKIENCMYRSLVYINMVSNLGTGRVITLNIVMKHW